MDISIRATCTRTSNKESGLYDIPSMLIGEVFQTSREVSIGKGMLVVIDAKGSITCTASIVSGDCTSFVVVVVAILYEVLLAVGVPMQGVLLQRPRSGIPRLSYAWFKDLVA
jgi:hypothetical protein